MEVPRPKDGGYKEGGQGERRRGRLENVPNQCENRAQPRLFSLHDQK